MVEVSGETDWESIDAFLQSSLANVESLPDAEQAEFRDYYVNYLKRFSPYARHHFAHQTAAITAEIRARGNPELLEIGTGCGTEALWFALQGARVTSVDLSGGRMDVARARKELIEGELKRKLDITFVESSIFDYHPDRKFDLLWLEQTYHHLEPREKVAPKLFAMLKPGGSCHICEVNGWNPLLQAQFIKQRGFRTKTFFIDPDGHKVPYGDERITIPWALRTSLRRAGFSTVTSHPFRTLPNSAPPMGWLKAEKLLIRLLPAAATHFTLRAGKDAG